MQISSTPHAPCTPSTSRADRRAPVSRQQQFPQTHVRNEFHGRSKSFREDPFNGTLTTTAFNSNMLRRLEPRAGGWQRRRFQSASRSLQGPEPGAVALQEWERSYSSAHQNEGSSFASVSLYSFIRGVSGSSPNPDIAHRCRDFFKSSHSRRQPPVSLLLLQCADSVLSLLPPTYHYLCFDFFCQQE